MLGYDAVIVIRKDLCWISTGDTTNTLSQQCYMVLLLYKHIRLISKTIPITDLHDQSTLFYSYFHSRSSTISLDINCCWIFTEVVKTD